MIAPRRFLLLALAGLLGPTPPAFAFHATQTSGPATLDLRADSPADALSLSDVLAVTLTVEGGPGLQVDVPRAGLPPAGWLLVEREPPTREKTAAGVRWRQTFLVAPAAVGAKPWQFPTVRYYDRTTPEEQEAAWPPLTIRVLAPPDRPGKDSLRDVAVIEELPPGPPAAVPPWLWLTAITAIVGVLVGVAVYWRTRPVRVNRLAPAALALRRCDRLLAFRLPEQGRHERFVTLLTLILRRYLERQFQAAGRRRTTGELLAALAADARLDEAQRRFLASFLARCDLIKFARAATTAAGCEALAREVRAFVAATARPTS